MRKEIIIPLRRTDTSRKAYDKFVESCKKKADEMERLRARDEIVAILVSALPVFASGASPQLRDTLTGKFAELFEKNMRPRFRLHLKKMLDSNGKVDGVSGDCNRQARAYLNWISEIYSNFGGAMFTIKKTLN